LGGGFGGLCRILSDFIPFETYTLIDQPEALMLAKKFLGKFPDLRSRIRFISCFNTSEILELPNQDLVIACSSLAELSSEVQNFYSSSLISNSSFTYLVYNTIHISESRKQLKKMIALWRRKSRVEITCPWHSILHVEISPGSTKVNILREFFTGPLSYYANIVRFFKKGFNRLKKFV
jgi:hypothetical protein